MSSIWAASFSRARPANTFLNNFPDYGTRTRVTWQESKQNFIMTGSDTQVAPIDGTYFGAITSVNTGCTTPSNNGSFFEVDRFTVTYGAQALLTLTAANLTAANSAASCTFSGNAFYTTNGGDITVPAGTFTCTNGLQGTWAADRMLFDPVGMLANLTTKYTVGETCSTVSHIGGAR